MNKVYNLVIDTHVLQAVFCQYNTNDVFRHIQPYGQLTAGICKAINGIIDNHSNNIHGGYVMASALAFVEIANKFSSIAEKNNFNCKIFKAFITQPPVWFIIEAVSLECLNYLKQVPSQVMLKGKWEAIEIADALHVATAMLREGFLATHDEKLACIPDFKHRIIK